MIMGDVARAEVLARAVGERAHALDDGGVLLADAEDAAEQVRVALQVAVLHEVIGLRGAQASRVWVDSGDMGHGAVLHVIALALEKLLGGGPDDAPDLGLHVVDGHPHVPVSASEFEVGGDHGDVGHEPLVDAPVVVGGVAGGALGGEHHAVVGGLDDPAGRGVVEEEIAVLAGDGGVTEERAPVEEADVAGVDVAFERLYPVALLVVPDDVPHLRGDAYPLDVRAGPA